MPNTIALFSSARRHGNTGRLIDHIATDLDIEVVDLADLRITPFDYNHFNRNDDLESLMEKVLKHDEVIFASPIYWYSVTPVMKAFLDRISDFLDVPDLLPKGRKLRGKTAWIVCTSIDDQASPFFIGAFLATFEYLGMHFGGTLHINCTEGYLPAKHEPQALRFSALIKQAGKIRQSVSTNSP